MNKAFGFLMVSVALVFSSCASMSSKKAAQNVEFGEQEVPYIQQVKKDGKLTAEIVEPVSN